MALKKKLSGKLFAFLRGGFARLWNQNQNRLQWALLSMVILDIEPTNVFVHEPRAIEMFQTLKQKTEHIFLHSSNEYTQAKALRYLLECETEHQSEYAEYGKIFSLKTFFYLLQG